MAFRTAGSLTALAQMKKTPPAARSIGSGVGVLLSAIDGTGGNPGFTVTLTRMGTDPQGTMAALEAMVPEQISNAVLHALLTFIAQTPDMSDASLEALASTAPEPWAPPLAAFGKALVAATRRCVASEGRAPMGDTTTVVCVDGSRLSFLALEVATQLRKHGRLVVLHVSPPPSSDSGSRVELVEDGKEGEEKEGGGTRGSRSGGATPADLGADFLSKDLEQRCVQQFGIAPHQFSVVAVGPGDAYGASGGSIEDMVAKVVAAEKADTVVLGVYGTSGARIGSLGACARWAIKNVACATVLANPYSSPLPSSGSSGAAGGALASNQRASLFMAVLKAERPLNLAALRATMGLMSYWHNLLVLVLLTEAQTKAVNGGKVPATPSVEDVTADLAAVIDAAQMSGRVKVEEFVATKTSDQLIAKVADEERADFLALDREDNFHSGILKTVRASVILVPCT